jgi:hypothetical protein
MEPVLFIWPALAVCAVLLASARSPIEDAATPIPSSPVAPVPTRSTPFGHQIDKARHPNLEQGGASQCRTCRSRQQTPREHDYGRGSAHSVPGARHGGHRGVQEPKPSLRRTQPVNLWVAPPSSRLTPTCVGMFEPGAPMVVGVPIGNTVPMPVAPMVLPVSAMPAPPTAVGSQFQG